MNRIFLVVLATVCFGGCAEMNTRTAPKADLSRYNRIFVEHLLTDGRGVDQAIVRELRHLGYDASFGAHTMMPPNTELLIRYQDQWTFDFTTYMISIDLEVSIAKMDKLVATAHHFRPSITGESPAKMVDVVLDKLFKAKGVPLPDLPPPSDSLDSGT